MLSNILIKLKNLLNNNDKYKLSEDKLKLLAQILKHYNNKILDIDVVKTNLRLTYKETNDLMLLLARNNIVKLNYRIWCDNPNNNSNILTYENIYDIPFDECDVCEKRCKMVKNNIIIVYRVSINE